MNQRLITSKRTPSAFVKMTEGQSGLFVDGDEKEGAGRGASLDADQHGQPGVDVLEPGPVEGGRVAGDTGDGDESPGLARFRTLSSAFYTLSNVGHAFGSSCGQSLL